VGVCDVSLPGLLPRMSLSLMGRTHNVPLPDEYDQISRDMHLFHPHRPASIFAKAARVAKLSDTFTLKNTAGKLSVQRNFDGKKHPGGEQRIKAQTELVQGVAEHIGDFEAVWSVHDTGRTYISWTARKELERAVRDGSCECFLKCQVWVENVLMSSFGGRGE
jgi:hypothetical protein